MEPPRPRIWAQAKSGTAAMALLTQILQMPPKMPKAVTRFTWAKATIPFMAFPVMEPQGAKT